MKKIQTDSGTAFYKKTNEMKIEEKMINTGLDKGDSTVVKLESLNKER